MKTIVIGGDAAGMSAAAKLKRLKQDSEIVVYEKGGYLSYASCGLPYYVAYENMEKESLIQRTKEQFEASGIKPLLGHEVLRVMPADKKVLVQNHKTGETFEDSYDKLMIATGAHPVIPSAEGVEMEGVHTLKTVDDGAALKSTLSRPEIRQVAIIGGGYIGVEAAEALISTGKRVRIIQRPDVLIKNFDPEISSFACRELQRLGVEIRFGERLQAILGTGRVEGVRTDKGVYAADAVILAMGVVPATEFLRGSGIRLAENGAVVIDREMRTSLPDVYSAGDCAEVYHLVKQENSYIPLATTANKCGRIAGENLAGGHVSFVGTLGSAAVKVGELELARTGLSEGEAARLGLDVRTAMITASDLPHYYPGSTPVTFKVIYESGTRRILGAQGVGAKNAVLRVDVFAAAIANRMTADELGMLDLCYAPPFSTPWDAVHVAANAAK